LAGCIFVAHYQGEIIQVTEVKSRALSTGDWVMAVVSFFLTPIVSIILAIYNFARSRKPQGVLYLCVLAIQVVIGFAVVSG